MGQMHVVDYKIFGDDMQFVEIELDPGVWSPLIGDDDNSVHPEVGDTEVVVPSRVVEEIAESCSRAQCAVEKTGG